MQHNHNDKQTIVRCKHLPRPSSRGKLGAWTTLKTKKMNKKKEERERNIKQLVSFDNFEH